MSEQGITARTSGTPAALRGAYPQLFVRDVSTACAYYADVLGFAIAYQFGEPPCYALIARGGDYLNVRDEAHSPVDFRVREDEELVSANIRVDGVRDLFLEYRRRGAQFFQWLKEQPWGVTDFVIRDPDGNLIRFASAGTTGDRRDRQRPPEEWLVRHCA